MESREAKQQKAKENMFRSFFLDGWSDRVVRWVNVRFDAADSERTVRPESPTSPPSTSLHSHANKNSGKGGKGKEENHTFPKGSVNHGQAASG